MILFNKFKRVFYERYTFKLGYTRVWNVDVGNMCLLLFSCNVYWISLRWGNGNGYTSSNQTNNSKKMRIRRFRLWVKAVFFISSPREPQQPPQYFPSYRSELLQCDHTSLR